MVRELDPVARGVLVFWVDNTVVRIIDIAHLGEDLPADDSAALAVVEEILQVDLASGSKSTVFLWVQLRIRPATNVDLACAPPLDGGAVRPIIVGLIADSVVA